MKRENIGKCRKLRKNQTDAEKKLWTILRNRQINRVEFRRQFSIGRYVLDFYCPEFRLGIEADGGQHYQDKDRKRDEIRRGNLKKLGVEIIRFNDREILTNINGVYEIIQKAIEKKKGNPPSPQSSPQGERKQLAKFPSPLNKREKPLYKVAPKIYDKRLITICTNSSCRLRKAGCRGFEGCPGYMGR